MHTGLERSAPGSTPGFIKGINEKTTQKRFTVRKRRRSDTETAGLLLTHLTVNYFSFPLVVPFSYSDIKAAVLLRTVNLNASHTKTKGFRQILRNATLKRGTQRL